MNQLEILEKPEYVNYETKDSYGYTKTHGFNVVPYSNEKLFSIVTNYGIKLPFSKIISKDQGISVCKNCKAVYVGTQDECLLQVRKINYKTLDYYERRDKVVNEDTAIGQTAIIKIRYEENKRVVALSEIREVCGGSLDWNLKEEFQKQVSFFNMLEIIRDLQETSPFKQFSDTFLPGVKQHLETMLLLSAVQNMQIQLVSHRGALEQIAQKMNSAGQNLTF